MDYLYKVEILRVVDGDTVDVNIDLGFDISLYKRVRLHGIDAPETRTRDKAEKIRGFKAKARLEELLLEQDKEIYLYSIDKGKYGRCVGSLFYADFLHESIGDILIKEGHASKYEK